MVRGYHRGPYVSPALDLRTLFADLPSRSLAVVARCGRTARRLHPMHIDLLRIHGCTLAWPEEQRALAACFSRFDAL